MAATIPNCKAYDPAFAGEMAVIMDRGMREMLVELGIPSERIQAAGRGKRELLVPTEENVSEARNRRVELRVMTGPVESTPRR